MDKRPRLALVTDSDAKWQARLRTVIEFIAGTWTIEEAAESTGATKLQVRRWTSALLRKHFDMTYRDLAPVTPSNRFRLASEIARAEELERSKASTPPTTRRRRVPDSTPTEPTDQLDIACELLHTALRCYVVQRTYHSALHLAGAADELLGKRVRDSGGKSAFEDLRDAAVRISKHLNEAGVPSTPKVIADVMNFAKNATKHPLA